MANTVQQQIAVLEEIRDGYLEALRVDAANPQPDQNFDGQQVEYVKWRRQLLLDIQEINVKISMLQPFEITTVQP